MGAEIFVAKIVFALIFALIVVWVLSPVLSVLTLFACTNCNGIVNAFTTKVIPILVAFIGIYKIFGIFNSTPSYGGN